MKKLILGAVLVGLVGCSSLPRFQDGYQLGDISRTAVDSTVHVLTIQQQYCASSDPIARQVLLKIIRSVEPDYPTDGLCTDVLGGSD